jgi:hypothetical protein
MKLIVLHFDGVMHPVAADRSECFQATMPTGTTDLI